MRNVAVEYDGKPKSTLLAIWLGNRWPVFAALLCIVLMKVGVLDFVERGLSFARQQIVEMPGTEHFVIVEATPADIARSGQWPIGRRDIAQVVGRLVDSGIDRLFVSLFLTFEREGDDELAKQFDRLDRERVALPTIAQRFDGEEKQNWLPQLGKFAEVTTAVSIATRRHFDGTPDAFLGIDTKSGLIPSAPNWLAGPSRSSIGSLASISRAVDIPVMSFEEVLARRDLPELEGKRVILGMQGVDGSSGFSMPWRGFVPTSRLVGEAAFGLSESGHVFKPSKWATSFAAGVVTLVLAMFLSALGPLWLVALPIGAISLFLSAYIELYRFAAVDIALAPFVAAALIAPVAAMIAKAECLAQSAAKAADDLVQQGQLIQNVINRYSEPCLTLAADGSIAYRNSEAAALLLDLSGGSNDLADALGSNWQELLACVRDGGQIRMVANCAASEREVELVLSALGTEKAPLGMLVLRDVTEREAQARRLTRLALFDELTQGPNRRSFDEEIARLQQRLEDGERVDFAIMLIDLNGFKAVNDRLGHAAGDRLLAVAAERMRAVVGEEDMVARLGGDEFGLIVRGCKTDSAASVLGWRIVRALEQPVELASGTARIGGSVGIALGPVLGQSLTQLLARADEAMYSAKRGGKGVEIWQDGLAEIC